ncbi:MULTISPECIES: GTPase ObgE [unclassified Caloramator]|uniref:GTPase ObgE n=1 Tax=unclassified Caloramator TaxID=2629145 RepID=UPI00237E04D0|nr:MULTISPECIES: GTPase ObgE [unclassified Caloramator]MDO6355352.1 GTPase ObgE [Caloramator sp. CAR-1]WDU84447.1 GTPase ObgE [Caloramator sp. Dgby_cultured_2]
MFVDVAKIYVKAGDGGHGAVSFRREKYVPFGGPDGGDGGKGGDVIFVVDKGLRTLLDFRYKKKYIAMSGENGGTNNKFGKDGEDLVIKVPPGTVIKDAETNRIIADLKDESDVAVVAKGGRGGRGNTKFATPTRQAPNFAEPGMPGEERWIVLELKLLADVGLVGFPNVGKSTILSMVTGAKPKIANYHFTTLTPNLGVVDLPGVKSFVLADIPGIIEGAHEGAGLGIDFLRHIERTRVLIHVVDVSGIEGRDPIEDFYQINEELKLYNEKLSKKPQIVAANKMDIPGAEENFERLKAEMDKHGIKVFKISAATNQGLKELMQYVGQVLENAPYDEEPLGEFYIPEDKKFTYTIKRADDGAFEITGSFVDRLLLSVNIYDSESLKYFHKVLERKGIIEELKQMGIKDGDIVRMNDFEFEFVE